MSLFCEVVATSKFTSNSKVPAVRTSVMQPRPATGGSGPVCTPIASITPYQVALVIELPNFDLSRKSYVNSVVEQVDNQGEGDEQERREDLEQVNRLWKTLLHGSYG